VEIIVCDKKEKTKKKENWEYIFPFFLRQFFIYISQYSKKLIGIFQIGN